jgi:hypothetical protein
MNGSGQRGETQTSFKSVQLKSWPQSADARTFAFAIESPRAASQRRRAHSKQQVAALVGPSVADAGQHGAHSKQLLATARRELRAARIALDAPLLRRKAHSAHGTVDAERGAVRRCVFEFAERQILDVHGSGVLDACKHRLQLLSARADVSVERADFEPAAPLRHLALALESNNTAPPSSTTRSDSNVANDDATRIDERRNALLCVAHEQRVSLLADHVERARRSRKCFTAVINSHLAHMRIEFSCTASSMIVRVTNAGSSRSWRATQISVARARIVPMCVVAARISLTRRAHCLALSLVNSNGNPAIVGNGFPSS